MSEDFSNATPRPWSCKWNGTCWQIDGETNAVATTQFCYADDPGANARLIVDAVNAYRDPRIKSGESEADVERVEEALKQCTFPDNRHYYWLARAAIAAMQGARK